MRTSERLDKLAESLQAVRADMRRFEVDLPDGRTLDVVEGAVLALTRWRNAFQEEAAHLRRYQD